MKFVISFLADGLGKFDLYSLRGSLSSMERQNSEKSIQTGNRSQRKLMYTRMLTTGK